MKNHLLFTAFSMLLLFACTSERSEDLVKEPNKDGSIETAIAVEHLPNVDILKTTHKIWVKGNLDKQIVTIDTLKKLGSETKIVEDENEEEKNVTVDKEYEIYLTVK
jgi:hypothetical protein